MPEGSFVARRHLAALVLTAGAILAALVYLSVNVTRDLRLLNSASSDNVQWTLSQTEVEFLEFQFRLSELSSQAQPDLTTLRRKYDIFLSRIATLERSAIYKNLHADQEFLASLEGVQRFLDRTVPLIDAPDATLRDGLPLLLQQTMQVRGQVRALANSGLYFFASDSDRRRENVAATLTELALSVTVLVLGLLALAVHLHRLNRQSIRRGREVIDSARRMNIVTSTALDAVIVTDRFGKVLDFNAAAETIFGYSSDEAIGQSLSELIVPDHYRTAHEAGLKRMREGGERRAVGKGLIRLEAKRKSGDIFPVEFAIQSATTDEGEIFVSFLRDISYRVGAERELVEARDQALRGEKAKAEFLAMMSHEIRTPLNGLLGNLALLQNTSLDERQARYVRNMDSSGKLLMSHVSDVLDITKYDAGKLRLRPMAMNVSALLQDIVDSQGVAARARGTVLHWGWTGQKADWIRADRERLQHILMNVIGNAVKFTPNGRVDIALELQTGSSLLITVSDTGIGMDAELQARIFDDFVTGDSSYDREVGGTGLGLGIAQRFVRALGGSIEVESAKGRGSRFVIRLPVEPVDGPDPTPLSGPPSGGPSALRILLVEDNEINMEVAREMLLTAGHSVTEAHNGREAVDRAGCDHFDLILMDISMPVMNGREAARAIRAGTGASAHVPIIAVTAHAVAEEQERFLSDGMDDIVTKPLNQAALDRVLTRYGVGAGAMRTAPTAIATETHVAEELRSTLGAEALARLLTRFGTEVGEMIALAGNLDATDLGALAATAHKIAGSAALFGATGLRDALLCIETAAGSHERDKVRTFLSALPAIWNETRCAFDKALG